MTLPGAPKDAAAAPTLEKRPTKRFEGRGGSVSLGASAAMPNPMKRRVAKSKKRF